MCCLRCVEKRIENHHFMVALVEQISSLHHRRLEVIYGVTDVGVRSSKVIYIYIYIYIYIVKELLEELLGQRLRRGVVIMWKYWWYIFELIS